MTKLYLKQIERNFPKNQKKVKIACILRPLTFQRQIKQHILETNG